MATEFFASHTKSHNAALELPMLEAAAPKGRGMP